MKPIKPINTNKHKTMKPSVRNVLLGLGLISTLNLQTATAYAQGTAFTYQGRLQNDGGPASGIYDLRFTIHDAATAGATLGAAILTNGVPVTNGLFTVTLDFGANVFTGPARWLEIAVRTNGAPLLATLTPRTAMTASPYAIHSGAASTVPNNAIGTAQIATGGVQTSDILDGTVALADLNTASVDTRYVLKAGDTMTGNLRVPALVASDAVIASMITNTSGILSLKSRTDIELQLDTGGIAASAFEIFNGAGSHLYVLTEAGNARVYGNSFIDGLLGVGTTVLDAQAVAQFNLPNSVSVPHVRIKSALTNNGFGLQFANPTETWFVGPNIGNWPDQRFCVLADSSNKGLIVAANGNVGIDSVAAASPFATLTVDGTIGFPTVSTPAMYVYPSGTANPEKRLIVHSPTFNEWGLYYRDVGDQFVMKSSAADTTPSLMVDLDGNWVAIGTDTPKPGYELSVDGQIVCEEILVQDSGSWPDYVFNDDYPLRPLTEVETHIREKKHLPGIPTAAEVKRDGLSLGEMQKRMLEKIEELTLYVIDQNKKLAAQEERIRQLEAQRHARQ
ncbi:MAG: hypothetical protein KJ070_26095 [Verrucomicrobia bacterium]|nr:hypothetical protein [Verrucomicrobiota bacterium]